MNAIVIFDVSDKLDEIKSKLKINGYWNAWMANGKNYNLPLNAMWKPNCDLTQAKIDVQNAVTALNNEGIHNVQLLRCVVLSVNPWEAI